MAISTAVVAKGAAQSHGVCPVRVWQWGLTEDLRADEELVNFFPLLKSHELKSIRRSEYIGRIRGVMDDAQEGLLANGSSALLAGDEKRLASRPPL
ncbi:hypothetical protein CRG98_036702 [Punica granatum]|uniref:Uncharacterized protein n=1 Tax=Punica granatum TaxID=22663 RepID=A0A2I0IFY2_PUNGR|nr:hypothetical protein CRG98_036702 [Punica granatum]